MALKLKEVDLLRHSETSIYGVPYSFTFEDGDILNDPANFKQAVVMVRVGSQLNKGERQGIVSTFSAMPTYKPWATDPSERKRSATMSYSADEVLSVLETETTPSQERIEELSLELAQLSLGEIANPMSV